MDHQEKDETAVAYLATAMNTKLARARAKGRSGWGSPECTQQHLSNLLREHVEKGDPVDVANFCAFLAARGEGIAPRQCLAQIEEPAQPVAEICSASHDDAQFGERAIKPLRDISGFEYGTPLYAGAAPAAVAGPADDLAELAMLNKLIELGAKASYANAQSNSDDGRAGAEADDRWRKLRSEMGELIRAHKAPALEAPAAPALPAAYQGGMFATTPDGGTVTLRFSDASAGEQWFERLTDGFDALAAAPQAPAAPWKDHLTARLVNDLRDCAIKYHGAGQLRDRIAHIVAPLCDQLKAAQAAPAAPAVDAETIHLQDLKNALAECQELRQQLTLMDEQQAGSIWRWQADDQDQIETMGNRMGVLIYACDLRALLARAAPAVDALDADRWRALEGQMDAGRVSLTVHHTEAEQWDGRTISDAGELQDYADSLAAQATTKGANVHG